MEILIFILVIVVLGGLVAFFFLKPKPTPVKNEPMEFPNNPKLYTQENIWKALNMQLVQLHKAGEIKEATIVAEEALNTAIKAFGENHIQVATSLNNLAAFYKSQGKFAEAEPLYTKALSIWETNLGKGHPDVGSCLNNLGDLYFSCAKYDESEKCYKDSLEIFEKKLGRGHQNAITVLENIIELYKITGKNEKVNILEEKLRKIKLGQ
jgi:tetratricopeptide (TPR) repeat protein